MAFQDEFWALFINIWLAFFCVISQWLVFYLPGHQPISFYFCTGHNPSQNSHPFVPKRNTLLRTLNIGVIVVLFAMYIRIEIFKWKETNLTTWFENQKSLFLKDIEDKFLASYVMYMVTILNTIFAIIVKINSLKPVESNVYPNTWFVIFFLLIFLLQVIGIGACSYYREHRNLLQARNDTSKEEEENSDRPLSCSEPFDDVNLPDLNCQIVKNVICPQLF